MQHINIYHLLDCRTVSQQNCDNLISPTDNIPSGAKDAICSADGCGVYFLLYGAVYKCTYLLDKLLTYLLIYLLVKACVFCHTK